MFEIKFSKIKYKICTVCGKGFYALVKGLTKYCSDKCRIEGKNRRYKKWHAKKKALTKKECAWCGNKFIPNEIYKKYCSDECKKYGRLRRNSKAQRKYIKNDITLKRQNLKRLGTFIFSKHSKTDFKKEAYEIKYMKRVWNHNKKPLKHQDTLDTYSPYEFILFDELQLANLIFSQGKPPLKCPECESIEREYDDIRAEIICLKCGFVLSSPYTNYPEKSYNEIPIAKFGKVKSILN